MLLPLGDRLLVRRAESKQFIAVGIVAADNAKERPQEGEVLAIGPEVAPGSVLVGDIVLFGKYAGTDVEVDGSEYLLLRFDECMARRTKQDTPSASQDRLQEDFIAYAK